MLKGIMILFFGVVLCAANPMLAMAQEEADIEFSSGTILQISAESLTIEEYGIMEQKVFVINNETSIEGMESISELMEGDNIFIDYVEKGGRYIALNIFKSGDDYDEEFSEESSDELSEGIENEQEDQQ